MKEDKGVFLKVDHVEPDFKTWPSPLDCSRINGIKVWINGNGHLFECDQYTVCDPDVAREDGRRQVVALMNELGNMAIADSMKLFGYCMANDILNHFSYTDIVEKLDAWKKEKDEIHIKDEVQHKEFGHTAVVIDIMKDDYGRDHIYAITKKKEFITDVLASSYKKTGVHVDDLDAYLEV